jgi:hypothetical protein
MFWLLKSGQHLRRRVVSDHPLSPSRIFSTTINQNPFIIESLNTFWGVLVVPTFSAGAMG